MRCHTESMVGLGVGTDVSDGSESVRIAEVRVLQGLNVYAPVPVIRLTLEPAGRTTASGGRAFAEGLLEHLPVLGEDDGFAGRLRSGDDVPLTEVVARVATELQVRGGADLPSTAVGNPDSGAVYAYDDPTVGVAAGELSVRLVNSLLAGEAADLAADVAGSWRTPSTGSCRPPTPRWCAERESVASRWSGSAAGCCSSARAASSSACGDPTPATPATSAARSPRTSSTRTGSFRRSACRWRGRSGPIRRRRPWRRPTGSAIPWWSSRTSAAWAKR